LGIDLAQLVVRNIDDDVTARLQRRAKRHGRSMEEEVRSILRDAAMRDEQPKIGLGTRMRARFKGIELDQDIPEIRGQLVKPIDLSK
jgi:plasmid stability protein